MIAESVGARGGHVHIVAIEGAADPDIARFPHTWVNLGQIGRIVATLSGEGRNELVIAGNVRRPDLRTIRPDAGFFTSLPQVFSLLAGGDDSVLSRVVRFFEAKGLTVRGAHEVAPDLLADAGQIGAVALSPRDHADAMLGFAVRAALGSLDAGQAVAVADGRVLAIEGAEGTDAMLRACRRIGPRARRRWAPRRADQRPQARSGTARGHAGHRPAHGRACCSGAPGRGRRRGRRRADARPGRNHPRRQRARLRHGRIGKRRASQGRDVPGPRTWRGVSWGACARVCATGPISPAA